MKEQLISFETAKLAKDKGFNEDTELFFNSFYPKGTYNINGFTNYDEVTDKRDNFTSLPTQSLLQKWLREKHNKHIYLFPLDNGKWGFENNSISINLDHIFINYMYEGKEYNSYEEALEVGLQEALNFINSDLVIDNEG